MEELLNKIQEKYDSIFNQEKPYEDELQFFNNLCLKYRANDTATLCDINEYDLVLALLHVHNLDIDFKYTYDKFTKIIEAIAIATEKAIEKNKIDSSDISIEGDILFLLNELNDLIDYEKKYETSEVIDCYKKISEYKELIKHLEVVSQESDVNNKLKKLASSHFKNKFRDEFNIPEIMKLIEIRKQELLTIDRQESKKNNKKMAAYKNLVDTLKENERKPIMELPKKIEDQLDEEIIYEVMLVIHQNIEDRYKKIKETNEKLIDKNTVTKLDEVLFDYGISSINVNKKNTEFILKNVDLKQMKIFINEFLQMNFSIQEIMNSNIVYLFKYSEIEQVSHIKRLYEAKIIDKTFIIQNLGIFVLKESKVSTNVKLEPKFENIISNVGILKNAKIDFVNNEFYKPEILLVSTIDMLNNQKMCSKYFENSKMPKNCQLLVDENLFDMVDFCIENQIDINIVESIPNLTSSKYNIIKRILLCVSLGINYKDEKNKLKKEILTGTNFIVSDKELDFHIINQTTNYIDEECIKCLTTNKRNNFICFDVITKLDRLYLSDDGLSYNFDGVVISRNKVIRNFNALKDKLEKEIPKDEILFQSIIYLTILKEEQINKIKNCLSNVYSSNNTNKIKIK